MDNQALRNVPYWETRGRQEQERRSDAARSAKRVDFVSLKMIKESSLLYARRQVRCAEDAVSLAAQFLEDCDREQFVVIALDTKHQPTRIQVVSVGSLDATIVHPREVFKIAVLANSSAIVCLHCHPSGIPAHSPEDAAVTKRLCESGKILGIDVLDHIIIGDQGRFESLKAKGLV
ncbi:JAB domain-containing protein [Alicyclobacillus sp. ALC3]|nr:JAB domain-containing protein [Alicyclobacillus sp. ALC3]